MAASKTQFLKPEIVAQLGTMELRAATVVEGMLSGLHRSPFRGFSVEFAEYRQYRYGDEPKQIDWKTYARSDRYYVKEYEDETNLDAYLILDASASMGYGSHGLSKWQYAGILGASLAYLLHRQKDSAALVVLDEDVRIEIPPRSTRGHIIQMIGEMEKVTPSRKTSLAKVLHRVASRIKRKGMAIVISDLLDEPDEVLAGLRHLQFGGNNVAVFQTLDPTELHFGFDGAHLFIDPETNQVVPAMAEEVKGKYLKTMQTFLGRYAEEMGKTNIYHRIVDTSRPLDEALLGFLKQRGRG